jgi:hypothetical protein
VVAGVVVVVELEHDGVVVGDERVGGADLEQLRDVEPVRQRALDVARDRAGILLEEAEVGLVRVGGPLVGLVAVVAADTL